MKTTHRLIHPIIAWSSVRRLGPALVAATFSPAFAVTPDSAGAEPKTHTLFMGADLSVEQNQKLYRVQEVVGDSLVIKVEGKEVRIPVDRGPVKLQVDSALKLTETSASIANFKGERSYTTKNDPTANFVRGLNESEAQYADAQYAQNLAQDILHNVENKVVTSDGFHSNADVKAKQMANATQFLNTANAGPGSSFYRAGSPVNTEGMFDAMDVAFEVSSEKPLDNPYVLIVVQYRATGAKPGQVGNWIYARSLQPIGREARKVHIAQGGFPPGFELQGLQVHLYNRGEEIATDIAPKRVALTRDEAFQYVMIEYVNSHKGATLPATPAMGRLPGDWPARVAGGQFKETYYISVAKDGKPTAVFSDKSCSQKVEDPYLQSVVKDIRFKPALEQGKPVDGIASVKFADLAI
jgi:hypothetical protein